MSKILKPLTLAVTLALGGTAMAQDAATGLDMGQPVADPNAPGTLYVDEVFGDWEKRCVRNPEGDDPCSIHQLLKSSEGNPVAEVSFSRLPEGNTAVAGAMIVAPLETLLTQQLTIAVDDTNPRRYPFRFCTQTGCVAQVGFTGEEVAEMKAGNVAQVLIVPAAAPGQVVNLPMSLTGFTAAYDSLPVPPVPAAPAAAATE